jgi:hypothetical protein
MKFRLFGRAFLLLVLSLFAGGCLGVGGRNVPTSIVVVLFDKSLSTQDSAAQSLYMSQFRSQILPFIERGGTIAADGIDPNSLADSRFPVNQTFKRASFNDNPLLVQQRAKKADSKVMAGARAIVYGHRGREGTAILDGLEAASRFFANYPHSDNRYLVIFSDMIESSPRLVFTKSALRSAGRTKFIARATKAGRIPDLTGTSVYVVGAGNSAGGNSSSERYHEIEDFWIAYLAATGASLSAAHYGSTLIRFP